MRREILQERVQGRERQISENRKCAGELGEGGTVWRQKAKDIIEAVIGDTFL